MAILVCSMLATGMPAPSAASTGPSGGWTYIAQPPYVPLSSADPRKPSPDGVPLCSSDQVANIVCYSPAFVRQAYSFPPASVLDGSGQTIVIVDAYGSPTITTDLAAFDTAFGIPSPPSFTIYCGGSRSPLNRSTCPAVNLHDTFHAVFGWTIETTLDVEYAHAMAPGATIVLDVADSSSGNAINVAEASAIAAFPGAVFSQSFGADEGSIKGGDAQVRQADANYAKAATMGDTFLASAGDTGATFATSTPLSSFPASNPLNTSVTGSQGLPYIPPGDLAVDGYAGDGLTSGGCPSSAPFSCTTGLAAFHGPCALGGLAPRCVPDGYGGEQVWNEPQFGAATGGAESRLFGVPPYQAGLGLSSRGPDVSYNAAIDGGVLLYYSAVGTPMFLIGGGTSAGAPQWAAITALANEARAQNDKGPIGTDLNPALYSIYHSLRYATDFHDITVGTNQMVGTPVGFVAGPGYDIASGLGTPIVDHLIVDLADF